MGLSVLGVVLGKHPTLIFQYPFGNNGRYMVGFDTNFKRTCANQLYVTRRIFDIGINNVTDDIDIEFNYNLGLVLHDGKLDRDTSNRQNTKLNRNIQKLGSRIMFKHIGEVTFSNSTTHVTNNDYVFIYGTHSSNWGENTAYFGSSVKENAGIDIGGLAVNFTKIYKKIWD